MNGSSPAATIYIQITEFSFIYMIVMEFDGDAGYCLYKIAYIEYNTIFPHHIFVMVVMDIG